MITAKTKTSTTRLPTRLTYETPHEGKATTERQNPLHKQEINSHPHLCIQICRSGPADAGRRYPRTSAARVNGRSGAWSPC